MAGAGHGFERPGDEAFHDGEVGLADGGAVGLGQGQGLGPGREVVEEFRRGGPAAGAAGEGEEGAAQAGGVGVLGRRVRPLTSSPGVVPRAEASTRS